MIEHAGISEQGGVRYRNEDFIAHSHPEDPEICRRKGCLFVVADGIGGYHAGDVCSREASRMLVSEYYASGKRPEQALRHAFHRANLHVYDLRLQNASAMKMGTTMVAVALVGDQAYFGHVGDSRIYRVRPDGSSTQLSRDHSEVADMVRMQLIRPDQVRSHPRRNIITRSLGSNPVVRPDFANETVLPGDIFVLCTDGLWEPLEDHEIAALARQYAPEEACKKMVELALERNTQDNLSVQVIKVVRIEKQAEATAGKARQGWWTQWMAKTGRKEKGN